jgi:hypothetical protein
MAPIAARFATELGYWRLGLPLSVLVILLGTPLIALVFPFGASP